MWNMISGSYKKTPMLKVIKTDEEYQEALAEIRRLMLLDPDANTPEGNALELLALLIEQYELRTYEFHTPDLIDVICSAWSSRDSPSAT